MIEFKNAWFVFFYDGLSTKVGPVVGTRRTAYFHLHKL